MRTRWIAVATAAVLAIGVGVAWAAIPDSDGSVELCAAPEATGAAPTGLYGPVYVTDSATPCRSGQTRVKLGATGPAGPRGDAGPTGAAGAPGAAAIVPQVYEGFTSGDVSLDGKGLTLSLALPIGTYDVDASIEGSADDYHEKSVIVDSEPTLEAEPRAMGVFCTLDSPGRRSTSAGAAPTGAGAFSVDDRATISVTAPATLTYACHADDSETKKQLSDPKNGYIMAPSASRLSATMINGSAVAAVIHTDDGRHTILPTRATVTKALSLGDASDSGNDKKVNQILSKLKALAKK